MPIIRTIMSQRYHFSTRALILQILIGISLLATSSMRASDDPAQESSHASPLVVQGFVKDAWLRVFPPSGELVYELRMTIIFKNIGSFPLLIYADDLYPWLGGETLSISREEAIARNSIFVSGGLLSCNPPAWQKKKEALDNAIPPESLIRKIAPGCEWRFDKVVLLAIEKNGSYDKRSKPWEEIKKHNPLWLRLSFQLWPSNLEADESDPKYGNGLNKKWKSFGLLQLNYVTSDPIPVVLVD